MEAHYTDLRLPAAARCGCELGVPAPESAVAARNAADAAAINLSVDLEAHSAASLALLHEVDRTCQRWCNLQVPCPSWTADFHRPDAAGQTFYRKRTCISDVLRGMHLFPEQVHQHPQLAEPGFLRMAVRRYERCWLPLLADAAGARTDADALPAQPQAATKALPGSLPAAAAATEGDGGTAADCSGDAAALLPLAAPLDVAWVWMAHAIAPVHYREVQGLQRRMHCRPVVHRIQAGYAWWPGRQQRESVRYTAISGRQSVASVHALRAPSAFAERFLL